MKSFSLQGDWLVRRGGNRRDSAGFCERIGLRERRFPFRGSRLRIGVYSFLRAAYIHRMTFEGWSLFSMFGL